MGVAEDAFQCLCPAFEQMCADGPAEGCPFAFNGHAVGAFIATLVAARVRAEFELEPVCTFFSSAAAPSRRFFTREGIEMMRQHHRKFISSFGPAFAGIPADERESIVGTLCLAAEFTDRVDHLFHISSCPLYVFVDTHDYIQHDIRKMSDFLAWQQWTIASCEVISVEVENRSGAIKFHPDVT